MSSSRSAVSEGIAELRERLLSSAAWRAVWVVDFEFCHDPDGRADPICLAAANLVNGRQIALWRDQMGDTPPYDIDENSLFICYSGQEAELACHLKLGWKLPTNIADLIVVYRMAINGLGGCQNIGLFDALTRCQIPLRMSLAEKKKAQLRAAQGWPFTAAEQDWLLDYCRGDVEDETALLLALMPAALSPVALWHGRFIAALARMWWRGVPIDPVYVPLVTSAEMRLELHRRILAEFQNDFPIYDETGTRKDEKFVTWLEDRGIPVPRTKTGRVSFALATLQRLAADHPDRPELALYAEAKQTLDQLKDYNLPIGRDCRLRAWFAPFGTITGRANPPTNAYIYNLPAWSRATMMPSPGRSLAYLDFASMEFGLSAVVTSSATMKAFYGTGEPYLATASAAGAVPRGATKKTHPEERKRYKTGVLASLYGIAAASLGQRLREPTGRARQFLQMHHEIFADYWRASDGMIAEAVRCGGYTSRHGWHYAVVPPVNERSLRNWPIQTLGSDVLRCSVIFADALGVEMLATAHDAVLIEADADEIEAKAAEMAYCMKLASAVLCDGFTLNVDTDIKRHGERFLEERGERTFAVAERFITNGGVASHAA